MVTDGLSCWVYATELSADTDGLVLDGTDELALVLANNCFDQCDRSDVEYHCSR